MPHLEASSLSVATTCAAEGRSHASLPRSTEETWSLHGGVSLTSSMGGRSPGCCAQHCRARSEYLHVGAGSATLQEESRIPYCACLYKAVAGGEEGGRGGYSPLREGGWEGLVRVGAAFLLDRRQDLVVGVVLAHREHVCGKLARKTSGVVAAIVIESIRASSMRLICIAYYLYICKCIGERGLKGKAPRRDLPEDDTETVDVGGLKRKDSFRQFPSHRTRMAIITTTTQARSSL